MHTHLETGERLTYRKCGALGSAMVFLSPCQIAVLVFVCMVTFHLMLLRQIRVSQSQTSHRAG